MACGAAVCVCVLECLKYSCRPADLPARMRWIKEDDGTQLQDQIWAQSSNPVTTTDGSVSGYDPWPRSIEM